MTSAIDSSGNGRDGSYVGTPTLGVAGLLTGDADTAVAFSGGSHAVTDGFIFNPSSIDGLAIEAIVNVGSFDDFACIAGLDANSDDDLNLFLLSDGTLHFSGGVFHVQAALSGGPHHVVGYFDASGAPIARLYIDGSLAASVTPVGNVEITEDQLLYVGSNPGGSGFDGVIDEVAVYLRAVGMPDVAGHAAAVAGGGYASAVIADSPILFWRLGDTGTFPVVTSVTPDSGPDLGGTVVVVAGSGFLGTTDVDVVDFVPTVTPVAFSVDNDAQITATLPAHTDGLVQLVVTNPHGDGAIGFTYTFTAEIGELDCLLLQVSAIDAEGFPDLLVDGTTIDGDGLLWDVASLQGWWDGTQVEQPTMENQNLGDGETTYAPREQARQIVVEIVAYQPSRLPLGILASFAISRVKDAFNCVRVPKTLLVDDGGPFGPLRAKVRRLDPIRQSNVGERHGVKFQVTLTATDPLRYDDALAGHE